MIAPNDLVLESRAMGLPARCRATADDKNRQLNGSKFTGRGIVGSAEAQHIVNVDFPIASMWIFLSRI